jgi:hypothetical protein
MKESPPETAAIVSVMIWSASIDCISDVMWKRSASLMVSATSAYPSRRFDGTQPLVGQVPPSLFFSMSATRFPARPSFPAAAAVVPPPRMMISHSFASIR